MSRNPFVKYTFLLNSIFLNIYGEAIGALNRGLLISLSIIVTFYMSYNGHSHKIKWRKFFREKKFNLKRIRIKKNLSPLSLNMQYTEGNIKTFILKLLRYKFWLFIFKNLVLIFYFIFYRFFYKILGTFRKPPPKKKYTVFRFIFKFLSSKLIFSNLL